MGAKIIGRPSYTAGDFDVDLRIYDSILPTLGRRRALDFVGRVCPLHKSRLCDLIRKKNWREAGELVKWLLPVCDGFMSCDELYTIEQARERAGHTYPGKSSLQIPSNGISPLQEM